MYTYIIYYHAISFKCVSLLTVLTFLAAYRGRDFNFIAGSRLHFADIETLQSISKNQVLLSIINDDISEPCEIFICTLQAGALYAVRGIEPNRVTIRICDDDREHWHAYQSSERL